MTMPAPAKRARKERKMPPPKRSQAPPKRSQPPPQPGQTPPNVAVQIAFLAYSQEMDARQTLHDKIFKLNGELINSSKQIICQLRRITLNSAPEEREVQLADAEAKLQQLRVEKLRTIAELTEGSDQHMRTLSGGIQEYIKALTFYHFLKSDAIPNRAFCMSLCSTEDGPRFPLSTSDYVLGFADLANELMRTATAAVAAGNRELLGRLLVFLQKMADAFQLLDGAAMRDLGRKLQMMRGSVCKVERLCYTMHVRGEEALPSHLVAAVGETEDLDPE